MSKLFKKGAVMEKAAEGMADQLEQALKNSLPDDLTPEQTAELTADRFEFAEFDDTLAEKTGYSSYSYWRSTFRSTITMSVRGFTSSAVHLSYTSCS